VSQQNQEKDVTVQLVDPDPVSLTVALFSAVIGAAGLIVNLEKRFVERGREQRQAQQDMANLRLAHAKADRALNDLEMGFRLMEKFFTEDILVAKVEIGESSFLLQVDQSEELNQIRKDFIDAGIQLEQALDGLSLYIDDDLRETGIDLANSLRSSFNQAKSAINIREFLRNIAFLLRAISNFIETIGRNHSLGNTPARSEAINGLINSLDASPLPPPKSPVRRPRRRAGSS